MRILITGIAGFIGSNLSRALLDRGHIVSGLDDFSSGKEEYLDPRLDQFWVNDMSSGLGIPHGSKYDMIVHLASKKIPREGGADVVLIENIMGMIEVLVSASMLDAKIIFASTSDVYGKQTEFHEGADSIIGPTDVSRWTYAISKLWQEQFLYAHDEVDFNIIRYFGSYGPYMALNWTAGPAAVFISQALKGEPLTVHGDGTQTRCFSHVDDIVDGTIRLMESDYNREVFNLGNPDEEISMYDFAAKVFGTVYHVVNGSDQVLRDIEEYDRNMMYMFLPNIRLAEYSKLKYEDVMRRVPDIDKAMLKLGWKPRIGLDEGLRRTIKWQRKEMGL